jgi:hypothetical protein
MDTKARIAELQAAMAELRDENAALSDLLRRVALCKGSNAKYPYWNWLCEQLVEGDDQSRLETTLGVLDDVAAGEEPHPLALRTLNEGARDLAERPKATGRVDRSVLAAVVARSWASSRRRRSKSCSTRSRGRGWSRTC